jgi:putative membrane protein
MSVACLPGLYAGNRPICVNRNRSGCILSQAAIGAKAGTRAHQTQETDLALSRAPHSTRVAIALTALAGLLTTATASAYVGHDHIGHGHGGTWNVWEITPGIVTLTVLTCAIYARGMVRRRTGVSAPHWSRHLAFIGGVAAVFLSVQSPLDYVAEHLFAMHQIQHVILRMIGPMLIALAAPQAMLVAGLPRILRRSLLTPIAGHSAVRGLFSLLTAPVPVTLLFIAALYVWQYPPYHDAALLDESIHDAMHETMLAAGLLFWWCVFDTRPVPPASRHGVRLMMLWIVILSNIALGAYTTLKTEILYPAYATVGRVFDIAPLTDESAGGFIIWMPSSMMVLAAIIVVIHRWGKQESRAEERRPIDDPSVPTTGAALVARARPKNRALAIGAAVFATTVFATAIFAGVLNHLNNRQHMRPQIHAAAPVTSFH